MPNSPRTILIIDANAEERLALLQALKQEREYTYTFVEEELGQKSLAAYLQIKPDCVLLADKLPDGDGLKVLEEMNAASGEAALPVILLMDETDEMVATRAINSGAQDCRVKGEVSAEYLRRAVHRVMEKVAMNRALDEQRQALETKNRELETHLAAAQHEMAERARREALRDNSEERFRDLIYALPVALYTTDREGRITLFNHPAAELWGRRPEIGREMWCGSWQILQPDGTPLPHDQCPMAITLRDGVGVHNQEIIVERPDGTRACVLPYPQPLRDASGEIVGAVNMLVDLTARKQAEEEHAELLAKERAAREAADAALRAKDEFLALVSHELRASLNAILGWSRILQTKKVDESTLERAIGTIERSARAQQQLIEDLLDTARVITGKLRLEVQPLDLIPVIELAIDIVRPAAEAKGIDLDLSLDTRAKIVTGDPARLQQVVWNLLSNAVKFTPSGGRIRVQLERLDPHIQLVVTDTGCGIRAEWLPYVFDRFYQADKSSPRRHSGLGLGLSLVRYLVELHGGTVKVESAGEGQGATFTVSLPVRAIGPRTRKSENGSFDAPARSLRSAILHGLSVLVVDDEADARELITAVLEQYGAQVTTAASAVEALTWLTNGHSNACPDVLVSDIGMPGEDGYALIRRVRQLEAAGGKQIPAVALTAYGRGSDRVRALSAGFQTHAAKPIEPEELAMIVASLTGRVEPWMKT